MVRMPPQFLTRRDVLAGLAFGVGSGVAAACSNSDPTGAAARSTSSTRPAVSGTSTIPPAPSRRFAPGTRPDPAKPEGVDTMPRLEHIVIYMQENHSFDNYFGMLGRGDGFTIRDGVPTNSNPDVNGRPVPVFHMSSTCDHTDQASQTWNGTHLSVNGGAMNGFVTSADKGGTGSMGYWDRRDIPFYYGLATTFPVCDRWFASAPCQTLPNRRFLQAATSMGIVTTDVNEVLATPTAPNGVIWERLNDHGITWANYVVDLADVLLFPGFYASNTAHVKHFDDFLSDCAKGTLPQVSLISPGQRIYSEENPWDIQLGEAYSASIVHSLMSGPAWPTTAMFLIYDEHGGYYDHVPPPPAVAPDDIAPRIDPAKDQPGGFDRYGCRVPATVISPFARKDYVSHVVHDHTSILKFIETKFNLGAMTYRDANADDLLDCFDFDHAAFADPPELPAAALSRIPSSCEPDVAPPPTR